MEPDLNETSGVDVETAISASDLGLGGNETPDDDNVPHETIDESAEDAAPLDATTDAATAATDVPESNAMPQSWKKV